MQRISVVGSTGAGKSHMARTLARTLGVPHLELDSVYHQADWKPLATDLLQARVREFATQERWIIDGNYRSKGVLDIVWQRADTVVWLDPSKCTVMWQVTTRSLKRAALGTELWNGNRERWNNLLRLDPEENVVLWAWTHFEQRRAMYEERMRDPAWAGLHFVRLCSRRAQRRFLARGSK